MTQALAFLAFAGALVALSMWLDRRAARRRRQMAHRPIRLPVLQVEREELAVWALAIGLAALLGMAVPLLITRY